MSAADDRKGWTELLTRRAMAESVAAATTKKPSRNKNGAVKKTTDGITFDSGAESARYMELALLQGAKLISQLEVQPEYPIIVAPIAGGPLVQVARYKADFRYIENGQSVTEEVKSEHTRLNEAYRLRKRLVEVIYGIEIKEVVR